MDIRGWDERYRTEGFEAAPNPLLIETAERVIDAADVVMELRIGAIQRNRPADQIQRPVRVAGLMRDQAEQVQAVGVIGIDRQDPPVKPFSRGKPPGLMMRCRLGQQRRLRSNVCGPR